MSIILSIKPNFAEEILNGTKVFEFRKTAPLKVPYEVYLYATSPVKKVVGRAILKGVHIIDLQRFDNLKPFTSSEEQFARLREYYKGQIRAYVLELVEAQRYDEPAKLLCSPPQSWRYSTPYTFLT